MTLNGKMVDCAAPLTLDEIQEFLKDGTNTFGRYLFNGWKGLTKQEVNHILQHGGHIVSAYESMGNHISYFSQAQGEKDARTAYYLAKIIGQPAKTPIHFAVDCEILTASDLQKIKAYFLGIRKTLKEYTVGVYGDFDVIQNIVAASYWQTYAWSAGKLNKKANVYQFRNDVTEHNHQVDDDKVGGGFWPILQTPSHTIQVVHPLLKFTHPYTTGKNVRVLQTVLNERGAHITVDGIFATQTETAVKAFQQEKHLAVDGIVGKNTWSALVQ